jgi:hypothetical protein
MKGVRCNHVADEVFEPGVTDYTVISVYGPFPMRVQILWNETVKQTSFSKVS